MGYKANKVVSSTGLWTGSSTPTQRIDGAGVGSFSQVSSAGTVTAATNVEASSDVSAGQDVTATRNLSASGKSIATKGYQAGYDTSVSFAWVGPNWDMDTDSPSGKVTVGFATHNLASGASVELKFTGSCIAANSQIFAQFVDGGAGPIHISLKSCASEEAWLTITNDSGSDLTSDLEMRFFILNVA